MLFPTLITQDDAFCYSFHTFDNWNAQYIACLILICDSVEYVGGAFWHIKKQTPQRWREALNNANVRKRNWSSGGPVWMSVLCRIGNVFVAVGNAIPAANAHLECFGGEMKY